MIQIERPTDLVARLERFSALADRRETKVALKDLRRYVGGYKFGERTITSAHFVIYNAGGGTIRCPRL